MLNDNYTQNYHVYHSRDPLAMLDPLAKVRDLSYDFEPAAIVTATSPDDAFALTNQRDEAPWTTGPAIVWCKNEYLRSTSVGDVITNQARTRSWLVLRDGFQEISRIFFIQRNGISIRCEKREKYYVLFFTPSSHSEHCWEAIRRSGKWSGVLDLKDGYISYPEDLTNETRLREIAEQYVDGRQQFAFSEDEDEDDWDDEENHHEDEDDWDDEENYREDEEDDENITGRIPCGWGQTLCTVLGRIVEALGAFCRFGNTANVLLKGYRRLKKLL
jgi:hypothetical protein